MNGEIISWILSNKIRIIGRIALFGMNYGSKVTPKIECQNVIMEYLSLNSATKDNKLQQ